MNESFADYTMATVATADWQDTIMLVENDERVRYALQFFLQHSGYEVVSAGSVDEAENYMAIRGSKNIAAVISDIHLDSDSKNSDGYAFYRRWKAEDPDLCFLLISGDPTVWELPAVRAQEVRFLAKPFNFQELLAAVRSMLAESPSTDFITG